MKFFDRSSAMPRRSLRGLRGSLLIISLMPFITESALAMKDTGNPGTGLNRLVISQCNPEIPCAALGYIAVSCSVIAGIVLVLLCLTQYFEAVNENDEGGQHQYVSESDDDGDGDGDGPSVMTLTA